MGFLFILTKTNIISYFMVFLLISFCIVCDYCQNLGVPHFGGEQPGDTYYFSPLNIYCFGVVDATCTPEKLYAYGYTEDHGAKGGNNVASLIMKALEDLGWLLPGRCGKRLSIIMDNCAGQNKNGHVLRLVLLLVELKFFLSVEFIFYVRGHTKNLCDRMFNLLKKRYHHSQIFSLQKLTSLLNELENVTYHHVTSEIFFDYNSFLDLFYKKFKPGTVKSNHLFWVEGGDGATMYSTTYYNEPDVESLRCNFLLNMDNREALLKEAMNNKIALPAPGLKPIKQVELWKKWGPFIPEDEREELCPKPPDDIIKEVASERAGKAATQRRKKRGRVAAV